MGSSLDDTIYGAAKKAFDFGAKLHAQNKEKKELKKQQEEEERLRQQAYAEESDDYEEEVSSRKSKKANKAAAKAGRMLGKGLKSLWNSAGAK